MFVISGKAVFVYIIVRKERVELGHSDTIASFRQLNLLVCNQGFVPVLFCRGIFYDF